MIRPIYTYGTDALRTETEPVSENSEELQSLIDDMIETMHAASGIGLAAPQIGESERIFVVDVTPMFEEEMLEEDGSSPLQELPPQPMVFINPEIVSTGDTVRDFEEGCLSIPEVREVVSRPEVIRVEYRDRDFEKRELEVGGGLARVIQHEKDHLDGVLFTDHLSAFRRRLLQRSLRDIAQGNIETDYPLVTSETEAPVQ